MTDLELVREGEWSDDGRMIMPGGVTWREEPLPVLDEDGNIIGTLTNIRRDGWAIYGTVNVDRDAEAISMSSDQLQIAVDPGVEADWHLGIASCRLTGGKLCTKDEYLWKDGRHE